MVEDSEIALIFNKFTVPVKVTNSGNASVKNSTINDEASLFLPFLD